MSRLIFLNKGLQRMVAIYLVATGLLIVFTNHGDVVLWLNSHHSPFADTFFKYWTQLGDGLLLGIVALVVLFFNYYNFFVLMISIALQTVFVHIFKQWLAAGEPRPKTYFADRVGELNFIEGVRVNAFDSFPSGHTASAFTLAFFLIIITKNKTVQVIILITAILVGLSRVYLLQHFLVDIYIGSVFGIISVLLAWRCMQKCQGRVGLERGLLKK